MPSNRITCPAPAGPFSARPGRVVLVVLLVILLAGGGALGFLWYQRQAEAERAQAEQAEAEARERERERELKKPSAPSKSLDLGRAGAMLDALAGRSKRSSAEPQQTSARLSSQLVGTWRTKPGAAPERVIEYRSDGTYRDALAGGRTLEGTWKVAGASGQKVLKVERTGGGPSPVRVTFEDGELIHDGDEPGSTSVLVKD
ncbi:MAG TPA: hypothetical protein VKE74_04300 [Gemmataceae bacterium]|nr:hypothetical protein [Gemmataceae bacterium]